MDVFVWVFFKSFSKKITNKNHIEDSNCAAYLIVKMTTFCSYFDPSIKTKHNRPHRNDDCGVMDREGHLLIFTDFELPLGQKNGPSRMLSDEELDAIYIYVLLHWEEIQPYIR